MARFYWQQFYTKDPIKGQDHHFQKQRCCLPSPGDKKFTNHVILGECLDLLI